MDDTNQFKTLKMRTWYGARARVTIGPGFVHKAGFGGFVVPHPPVVNWLLRKGLETDAAYGLALAHEFGHLQTAPMILVYAGAAMVTYLTINRATLPGIMITLAGAQATWEIVSELYAIWSDSQFYREKYQKIGIAPRLIFWALASALALSEWIPTML